MAARLADVSLRGSALTFAMARTLANWSDVQLVACERSLLVAQALREIAAAEGLRATGGDAEPAHRVADAACGEERAARRQRDRDVVAIFFVAALEQRLGAPVMPAVTKRSASPSRIAPTRALPCGTCVSAASYASANCS